MGSTSHDLLRPMPAAGATPAFLPHGLTLKELPGQTGRMVPDFHYMDVNSVENEWLLRFGRPHDAVELDVWIYELNRPVVPKWFGVGVAPGLSEFTRPHIFFHPTPGQAHYDDRDYAALTGKWRDNLVGYIQRMGSQVVLSRRKQVFIMPFLTEGVADTLGIFAAEWQGLVLTILDQLRQRYNPSAGEPQIANLVTSSFSAGVKYMHTFLHKGRQVADLVNECFDFDGRYSRMYRHLSEGLRVSGDVTVVNYDQRAVDGIQAVQRDARAGRGVHLPAPRWERFLPAAPAAGDGVHAEIPRYMMRHAMARSRVG